MVTTIRKDYSIKVSEYVNSVSLYEIKKLNCGCCFVVIGISSIGFSEIKNRMPLKLVRVAASREDDSGLQGSWNIGQLINMISGEDLGCGYILGLIHSVVELLG